jgi:hypothetical protein
VLVRDNAPELRLVREWLDSWTGIGLVIVRHDVAGLRPPAHGVAGQDWRANFFPAGLAHSIVKGSAWEPTPWRAVQRAPWEALDEKRV